MVTWIVIIIVIKQQYSTKHTTDGYRTEPANQDKAAMLCHDVATLLVLEVGIWSGGE